MGKRNGRYRGPRGPLPPMEHLQQDELKFEGDINKSTLNMGREGMGFAEAAKTDYDGWVRGTNFVHASGEIPGNASRQLHSAVDRFIAKKGNNVGVTMALQADPVLLSRTSTPTSEVRSSMGRHQRQVMEKRRQGNASAPPPPGPEPGKVCVACGIRGHMGKSCVMSSGRGDLQVCPFCDTFNIHLPEHCPQRFNDAAVVWDLFVIQRQGKCEIRTKEPTLMWPNLVRWQWADSPNDAPLAYYPHSWEFAKRHQDRNPSHYRTHDYTLEPCNLVADPRTKDRETLLANADFMKDYPVPEPQDQDMDDDADLDVDVQGTAGYGAMD